MLQIQSCVNKTWIYILIPNDFATRLLESKILMFIVIYTVAVYYLKKKNNNVTIFKKKKKKRKKKSVKSFYFSDMKGKMFCRIKDQVTRYYIK